MAPSAVTKDLKRKRTAQEEDDTEVEQKTPVYKQRVLTISSRGISQRQRHLMADLISLLPHSKKGKAHSLVEMRKQSNSRSLSLSSFPL